MGTLSQTSVFIKIMYFTLSLNNMSNIMEIIRIEVVGRGGGVLTEHEMRVAGGTADIETGQLLVM